MSNTNLSLPKSRTGKIVLAIGTIVLIAFILCNLFSSQIFQFGMNGLSSSFEKQNAEQIAQLQEALDIQCGVGTAIVSEEGFWSETPRRSEYGWSNSQVSCHGDDNLQQNKILCTCSR